MRVVEERDAFGRRDVLEPEDVADVERRDVDVDVLRDAHRQRLDVQLALDERDDAALLRALGLAHEVDDDRCLDHLVEAHLAQVDVREGSPDRVLLVVREDRGMHGRGALDHDVEDRVEPRGAGHRSPEHALGDCDRRRLSIPVQHAGNDPLLAQATRVARAELLTLAHLELGAVSGHGGRL